MGHGHHPFATGIGTRQIFTDFKLLRELAQQSQVRPL
jgi:hypothetical protein